MLVREYELPERVLKEKEVVKKTKKKIFDQESLRESFKRFEKLNMKKGI